MLINIKNVNIVENINLTWCCIDFFLSKISPTDEKAPSPPNCPTEPLTIAVYSGSTSAVVTFPNPSCFDTVQGTISSSCVPASNTSFPVGVTAVTCNCRYTAGLQSQCAFIVQVNVLGICFFFRWHMQSHTRSNLLVPLSVYKVIVY